MHNKRILSYIKNQRINCQILRRAKCQNCLDAKDKVHVDCCGRKSIVRKTNTRLFSHYLFSRVSPIKTIKLTNCYFLNAPNRSYVASQKSHIFYYNHTQSASIYI